MAPLLILDAPILAADEPECLRVMDGIGEGKTATTDGNLPVLTSPA
jgi:hypothetical protein